MTFRDTSTRARRGRRAVLVVLAAIVGLLGCADEGHRPTMKPDQIAELTNRSDLNLLFILVDTLRADRLGAYGYERDTSPVIDSLAESGIRFANHLSQSSWTKCSMASLWTGLYPARTGVLRSQHALAEDARLPAEILRDAGFRTAAIWRNGWIAPNFGFSQGFEIYHSPHAARVPAQLRRANPGRQLGGTDADLIRSASEFVRAHAEDRWFLYLHMMDVHQYTYDEPSALFGTTYSDAYDNSIRWTDSLLGHLLAELDKRNLRDKTIIVFASDHGEAFGEHDGEGHARNVYGEVTETPVIISLPFRLNPPIVVETRTANVDLWPTLLEMLGLPGLEDADGRSQLAAILEAASGTRAQEERPLFAQLDRRWARMEEEPLPQVAVTRGDWRLMYRGDLPQRVELFDKTRDPSEQRNLAANHPEVVEELREITEDYLEREQSPWGDTPTIEIDEMQLNQLRALGYGVE